MNLETVVAVEYGGGITFIKLRNPKDEESIFAVYDSVPLRVGYSVEIKHTSRIKIEIRGEEKEFTRITEMGIYDNKILIGKYKEKEFNQIIF